MAVEHFDIVSQRLETVGEALRHQKGAAVFGGEALAVPVEEGWGAPAQIHDYIPDLSANATDELHVGMRRVLEVHPADGATTGCSGVVDLGHGFVPTGRFQFGAEDAREKPPLIHDWVPLDQLEAGQRQVGNGESAQGRHS